MSSYTLTRYQLLNEFLCNVTKINPRNVHSTYNARPSHYKSAFPIISPWRANCSPILCKTAYSNTTLEKKSFLSSSYLLMLWKLLFCISIIRKARTFILFGGRIVKSMTYQYRHSPLAASEKKFVSREFSVFNEKNYFNTPTEWKTCSTPFKIQTRIWYK